MADTRAVEILQQNEDLDTVLAILRPVLWCLYLLLCALVANGIAEYHKYLPIAHERGLSRSILIEESFRRIDPGFAGIGLLVGIATLAIVVWTSRARRVG